MLLFKPIRGYYSNFTQTFKEARKYTQSAYGIKECTERIELSLSKNAAKKILPGYKTSTEVSA